MVTVFPDIVAGPDNMLKFTGKPDEAVALTVNGASPNVLFCKAPNVMV